MKIDKLFFVLSLIVITGAGCSIAPAPKKGPLYGGVQTPSVTAPRCNEILTTKEASTITGAAFPKTVSTGIDKEQASVAGCNFTARTDSGLQKLFVLVSYTSMDQAWESGRPEGTVPISGLGEDAFYYENLEGKQGNLYVLYNKNILFQIESSFKQPVLEQVARRALDNFEKSEYLKELQNWNN